MADTPRHLDPTLVTALGGLFGGLIGFAMWMTTGTFVFLPVFLAIGLVTGISIAQTRQDR